MKFRKFASAALAAAMLASPMSIIAYADTAAEAAMKKELTYVKQRVEIPEELSEFNYRTSKLNNSTIYYFEWSNKEKTKTISISIGGKVLMSYYQYSDENEDTQKYSFGKLTEKELISKAEEYIKQLNPTVYNKIGLAENPVRINIRNNQARVSIRRENEGVPVKGQTGTVVLDKNTGEFISFNINWTMGASFGDPEKAVSKEDAMDSYTDLIPLELTYVAEYDNEAKIQIPHLIYRQTKYGEIDAFTGKLSTFEESYDIYDDAVVEEAEEEIADAAPPQVNFTQQEIEKMEKEGSLVTAAEAISSLEKLNIFQLGSAPEVSWERCSYNEYQGFYVRNVSFESKDPNYYVIDSPAEPLYDEESAPAVEEYIEPEVSGSFTINAETGELISFNSYSGVTEKKTLTKKNASALMKSYFKKIAGTKASKFKFGDISYNYGYKNVNGKYVEDTTDLLSAYASAPLYAYDIPSTAEGASMQIDSEKKITSYHINYYGIEYPKPDDIITEEQAFEHYFENADFDMTYRLARKEQKVLSALVYTASPYLYIDAFSGKRVGYNGGEYVDYSNDREYTDLAGSKYRKIAEKLASYNIVLMDENGRLNEKEYITREEFSNLVSNIGCWYYNTNGGSTVLTRQFAAKILANSVISEDCAAIPGIFKTKYSDVKDSNKYIGYIAIADGLGYMSGKNGKFRPGAKVTRGEALQLVYDYLAD